MEQGNRHMLLLNQQIGHLFRDALRINMTNPAYVYFLLQTLWRQRKAKQKRRQWEQEGIHVPPFMIASITNRCNLQCKGCYNRAQHRTERQELSEDKLRDIIRQADELGISIMLLAGGEPMVRKEIFSIMGEFPQIIFPIFTNGLLLNEEMVGMFKKRKNAVPVISVEGHREETDVRRGAGVYDHLEKTFRLLKKNGIFFGTSITMTAKNFDLVTGHAFIEKLMESACRLFFYVEYVPVQQGTEDLVLTEGQRQRVSALMAVLRHRYPGLFIAFPGDEEAFGGCLAAGRGFIHVNAAGDVEPCPFAPYSDTSLKNMTLKEALQSEFLQTIRQHHGSLTETAGGCALWEKREWVEKLLKEER